MDKDRSVLKTRIEIMKKTRPTYTEEFRKGAVDLLRTSAKPLAQVARELGVSTASLRNWKTKMLSESKGKTGDEASLPEASSEDLWEENVQLRREVEYLKRQREILKKAASILAHDPQLGMQ